MIKITLREREKKVYLSAPEGVEDNLGYHLLFFLFIFYHRDELGFTKEQNISNFVLFFFVSYSFTWGRNFI